MILILSPIALAIVLAYFRLQGQVIPVHISLNEVGDRSDYWSQQADVDSVLGDRRYIEGQVLLELSQVCHVLLQLRWLCNLSNEVFTSSTVGVHFRDYKLSSFVVPVLGSLGLLLHAKVWLLVLPFRLSYSPAGLCLRLEIVTAVWTLYQKRLP